MSECVFEAVEVPLLPQQIPSQLPSKLVADLQNAPPT